VKHLLEGHYGQDEKSNEDRQLGELENDSQGKRDKAHHRLEQTPEHLLIPTTFF
jgi:hypothetical protein